jgi:hypothetical protein
MFLIAMAVLSFYVAIVPPSRPMDPVYLAKGNAICFALALACGLIAVAPWKN